MRKNEIHSQVMRLESLFKQTIECTDNLEMQSHWAKYLCVLTSGLLENAVKEYFVSFTKNRSHPYVINYVTNNLSGFTNPNTEKILTLAGSFNAQWRGDLKKYIEGERKDAINTIVNNRNNIAHGRHVGLTLDAMNNYFKKVIEVINFMKVLLEKKYEPKNGS